MGSELHFYIHMKPGERVETDLTLPPDSGAILTGVVRRADGRPASGAGGSGPGRRDGGTPLSLCYKLGWPVCAGAPVPPALYELIVHDGSAPVRTVDLTL